MYDDAMRMTCADRLIHVSSAISEANEASSRFDDAPPTNSPDICCSTLRPIAPRTAPVHRALAGARTPESTRNRTAMTAASSTNVTRIASHLLPHDTSGSSEATPSQPATVPRPAVPSTVTTAEAARAPPTPIARARLRSMTSQNGTSSVSRSQIARMAVRSEPMAPIAAPTRPTRERMPAMESPAGGAIWSVLMSPPSPTSPGTARSTASTRASHASLLPASQRAAIENRRRTPANRLNSVR